MCATIFYSAVTPATVFFYSRERTGEHAERHLRGHGGILQADCHAGFNRPYV
jgi:transposase